MDLGINLENKVSKRDLDAMRNKRKEYEDGYEPEDEGGFDDEFGGSGGFEDDFGGGGFGDDFGGGSSGFGDDDFGSGFGDDFGGGFGESQPKERKKDTLDNIIECVIKASGSFGRVAVRTVKSFKNRTSKDIGIISKDFILAGAIMLLCGTALGVLGTVADVRALSLVGFPMKIALAGFILIGEGIIGITFPAYLIESGKGRNYSTVGEEKEVLEEDSWGGGFEEEEEYEEVEDDYEDYEEDVEEVEDEKSLSDLLNEVEDIPFEPEVALQNVPSNVPITNREMLVNIMSSFLPRSTGDFSKRVEIDEDDDLFTAIECNALKAIASAAKMDFEDFDSNKYRLERLYDTLFTYELYITRLKKLNNTADIAREIVSYFREDSEDSSVTANVTIEGDFYKIVIFKGEGHVVTLGDILAQKETREFFKNEKNALPFCIGLRPNGKPLLRDGKLYDTLLVAGKPRSGKSWFTYNAMLELMMFNTPEDIQFLIIDPKESTMMSKIGLLPHVCGVHSDKMILRILDDLINKEGARRAKILADHECDTVWELRKKTNIKMPIIYLFIDEFMSVVNGVCASKENRDKLNEYLNILISQLPSKGIRLMFVPHRASGVVNKTQRTMIQFYAAVRAEEDVVLETLGIKKFDTPLIAPGDAAIKMAGDPDAMFIKGTAVGRSDEENNMISINVARAFYKMGFNMPDMSSLGYGFNRNENEVREKLSLDGDDNRIQDDLI